MTKDKHEKSQAALEYDIFVPLVESSGQRYAENVTQTIKRQIVEFFGGMTDAHHANEGWWKVGGMTLRDEIVIWRILSDRGSEGDAFIRRIKKSLEEVLKQDLILVIRRQVETFV
ncbi:MAG: hypothetical protein M3Q07_16335 [Pseudobdellovibrionaceae bacterium]|nr:hypothetical protein [Pseudobdellovibrionaceae bacterium]